MSKSVVINLGQGDLHNGFSRVTAQISSAGHPLPEQFIGSLPAAPALAELYRNWQLRYKSICDRQVLRSSSVVDHDDELEIDAGGMTNVSVVDFDELCQKLQNGINEWLKSAEFLEIDRQLRSQLQPTEEIRVIVETNDDLLRRLPWHRWDFFRDYSQAEMALSRPEYKRREPDKPKVNRNNVRILAILGNSQGIELETETQFLKSLSDSEVAFLVNPSRHEFNTQLWNEAGWDILFFAGHSQSFGETGRIYINENKTFNSLTIEQLEEALKAAIANGLHLAIFNSCDGLGLALALEKLHIPTVIVMREPVPNRVAQDFFKYFLDAFAQQRLPLYVAVQQARRKLQGLEDDFPGASWLPMICQNPAVEPATWLKLGGVPPCPYRGLFAFREEDAHLFFGREQFTEDLVKAVKKKPLVAVVGSSGSGKSSVVFAGLVPKLREGVQGISLPIIVSFRPGNNPFEALAAAIAPVWQPLQEAYQGHSEDENSLRLVELELAVELRQENKALYKIVEELVQQNFGTRLVLVADQFEELYTLCCESERQPFLEGLLTAVRLAPAFTLVLTLRADFYGHALSYRPFSDALQGAVYNLGPMSRQELHSAIEQPAALMQVRLEDGLTNKLINATWGHPGRLPLLEFALTALWLKLQSGFLTNEAYEEIGGVEEALANHAEAVYAQLNEVDRLRTQRVFMQLVHPGEGTETTRRLATRDEVKQENWDLVTRLASSRLVVTNRNESTEDETVEIVHEALIRSWGRLELWVQCDGEFRRWQEHLRAAIRQWESSDKDEGALLRGKPLTDAVYWQQQRQDELSARDADFIEHSWALRQCELKKQKRIRQLTISGLTGGLVGALTLAGIAGWLWQNSAISEVKAIIASSEAHFSSQKEFDALIDAIRAKRKLQKLVGVGVSQDIHNQVLKVLQQAVYRVVEYNRLLPEQSDLVWGVAISPDGQTIASASADKTVHLWSRDGKEIHTLKGHSDRVWGVAFSPDSQLIASASEDGTVKLWSRDGKELRTLKGHSQAVWGVAFSPDSQLIASASNDKTVKLWNQDGKELHTLKGHNGSVWGVAFSPDGQRLASTCDDGTVKLWSRDGKELRTLKGHSSRVAGVAFSPDGQLLASASDDKTVKLWSRDGKELHTLKGHDDAVWGVAFSSNGQQIATGSWDKTIKLWTRDGSLLTTLNGHTARVRGVAFSPDGQTIASVSEDKTLRLWKIDNTLLKILNGHSKPVIGVSFSPNGQLVASASDDGTVKLWNQNGIWRSTLPHKAKVLGVAISPDGKTIASAVEDGSISIWSIDGRLVGTFKGHSNSVWDVAFSPDSRLIASASADGTIKLWTQDGKLLGTFKGHGGEVREVKFSPDGQLIASASFDRTVKLWKLDGTLLTTFKGHSDGVLGLAFSPDGQQIASASLDRTVKLWKLDGSLHTTLSGHDDGVRGVAFSPDGQAIASASGDGSIKLWSRDGTLLNTLRGHSGAVWKVTFSPDGQMIASTSEDKTVILWNRKRVQTLDLLVEGCNWVQDYLKTNPNVSKSDRSLCDKVTAP